MERDPRLKLSIELTQDEAQVLLVYLERLLPNDTELAFREDDRLFNRAAKRLARDAGEGAGEVAAEGPANAAQVRKERAAMPERVGTLRMQPSGR